MPAYSGRPPEPRNTRPFAIRTGIRSRFSASDSVGSSGNGPREVTAPSALGDIAVIASRAIRDATGPASDRPCHRHPRKPSGHIPRHRILVALAHVTAMAGRLHARQDRHARGRRRSADRQLVSAFANRTIAVQAFREIASAGALAGSSRLTRAGLADQNRTRPASKPRRSAVKPAVRCSHPRHTQTGARSSWPPLCHARRRSRRWRRTFIDAQVFRALKLKDCDPVRSARSLRIGVRHIDAVCLVDRQCRLAMNRDARREHHIHDMTLWHRSRRRT